MATALPVMPSGVTSGTECNSMTWPNNGHVAMNYYEHAVIMISYDSITVTLLYNNHYSSRRAVRQHRRTGPSCACRLAGATSAPA